MTLKVQLVALPGEPTKWWCIQIYVDGKLIRKECHNNREMAKNRYEMEWKNPHVPKAEPETILLNEFRIEIQ